MDFPVNNEEELGNYWLKTSILVHPLNDAIDFRERLRFPRVAREPPWILGEELSSSGG
jgi:hypothetical protein